MSTTDTTDTTWTWTGANLTATSSTTVTIGGSNLPTSMGTLNLPVDRDAAIAALAANVGEQGQEHTMACLRIGYYVHEAHRSMSVSYAEIAAAMQTQGWEPPSASRVSVYLHAYRAWRASGFEWDDLTPYSIDTLYHAGKLIGRPNIEGTIITPQEALNVAKAHPPTELRRMSKKGGIEAWPNEPQEAAGESDVATVHMPRAALEVWDAFAARLGNVVGGAVSRTKALEFALMLMGGLEDEILAAAWDGEHGEAPDPNEEPFVIVNDEEEQHG